MTNLFPTGPRYGKQSLRINQRDFLPGRAEHDYRRDPRRHRRGDGGGSLVLMGRDRDASGNIIPGARIQEPTT